MTGKALTATKTPFRHVFDFGGDGTTDGEIWMRALSTGAIRRRNSVARIEHGRDHCVQRRRLPFASNTRREWAQPSDVNGPRVIWVRAGNSRRAALLKLFAGLLPVILEALDRGERIIEVS